VIFKRSRQLSRRSASALTEQEQFLQMAVGQTQTFANQLTSDHSNLTTGESSISAAINSVNQWTTDEIMKVMGGFGGAQLADLIGSIDGQMVTTLNNFQSTLEGLVAQNETASQAIF
jgi:hypothetical protein